MIRWSGLVVVVGWWWILLSCCRCSSGSSVFFCQCFGCRRSYQVRICCPSCVGMPQPSIPADGIQACPIRNYLAADILVLQQTSEITFSMRQRCFKAYIKLSMCLLHPRFDLLVSLGSKAVKGGMFPLLSSMRRRPVVMNGSRFDLRPLPRSAGPFPMGRLLGILGIHPGKFFQETFFPLAESSKHV